MITELPSTVPGASSLTMVGTCLAGIAGVRRRSKTV